MKLLKKSDDAGSDSSGDDGLPLHLERFAKVFILLLIITNYFMP